MANKKISELTAKGATIGANDLIEISEQVSPGVYTSKYVTGAELGVVTTFEALTDTPAYSGNALKVARVNAGETALEFATVTAGLTNFTESQSTTSPNNTTYANRLQANGVSTNVDFVISPKGSGAVLANLPDGTVTGGNKRGANAADLQTSRSGASQVASGLYSFLGGGNQNTASGYASSITGGQANAATHDYTRAGGIGSSATQQNAIAEGYFNNATKPYSKAIGGRENVADGNFSSAEGYGANTFGVSGRKVFSSHLRNATSGAAQKSEILLGANTTGNTATTLVSDTAVASNTNQLILSNNSVFRFKGSVVAKQASSTNVAVFDIEGILVRGANAASTTASNLVVTSIVNTIGVSGVALSADTTNGGLKVEVTGLAATTVSWLASIETTELIYA